MSNKVSCLICQKEFKQITNTHLKSHDLTVETYREKFPDALLMSASSYEELVERSTRQNKERKGKKYSQEHRKAISEGKRKTNASAWNKGVPMSEEQKKLISEKAKAAFANGDRSVLVYERTPEIREKISRSLTGRTAAPEASKKALDTRRALGHDLAFFRGKNHTDEAKAIIGKKSSERHRSNRSDIRKYMSARIEEANLSLLNSITDDVFELRCDICNYEFTRSPQIFHDCRFHTKICDQCYPISPVSNAENEVADYISSIYDGVILRSEMEIISPLELDIVLPEMKIAFEYCGLYWHSELAGKPRWYHRKKMELCQERGYRLITIFEDEWLLRQDIVKSMISNLLRSNHVKINARSCEVLPISSSDGNSFIERNHLQGKGRAKYYYGLFHNDLLVSVMSFSNSEVSRKSSEWDINRFCSIQGSNIRGAAGKLFKAFISDHDPEKVISYADLRWGTGSVYGAIGFLKVDDTVPNYWYFKSSDLKRRHRYSLRKTIEDDSSLTEWENRVRQGWNRIWDCGHAKWVWVK